MAGAKLWQGKRFAYVGDPFKHPESALATLFASIGNPIEKLLVLKLRKQLIDVTDPYSLYEPETHEALFQKDFTRATTLEFLQAYGFSSASQGMITRFFKPFFSGVFLEPLLDTPASQFLFTYLMFAQGEVALPQEGMGALVSQLLAQIPSDYVRTGCRVTKLDPQHVWLHGQDSPLHAKAVVVACDLPATVGLLHTLDEAMSSEMSLSYLRQQGRLHHYATAQLYYRTPTPPITQPILMLNGTGQGLVNNVTVPTLVQPDYATKQQGHLVSVALNGIPELEEEALEALIRQELSSWFGILAIKQWQHIKTYRLPHALPAACALTHPHLAHLATGVHPSGVFLAGDWTQTPSLNGALRSARLCTEALLHYLR
jgi:phytoene dehydrogenase-like protein